MPIGRPAPAFQYCYKNFEIWIMIDNLNKNIFYHSSQYMGFLLKNLLKFTGCVLPWFCIFVWINFATTNKPQKRQSGVYFILKKSNERNCYGEVAHVQFVVACHLLFKNKNFLFDQPFTFLIRKYNIASSGNTYVSNKRLYRNMLPPFYFWKY